MVLAVLLSSLTSITVLLALYVGMCVCVLAHAFLPLSLSLSLTLRFCLSFFSRLSFHLSLPNSVGFLNYEPCSWYLLSHFHFTSADAEASFAEEISELVSGMLTKLLALAGQVALQQLVHMEVGVLGELKRRNALQEEARSKKDKVSL